MSNAARSSDRRKWSRNTAAYIFAACFVAALFAVSTASAEPIRDITIDGNFGDWASVPSYFDPVDDQHDTNQDQFGDTPSYVDHPDVDLLEYKFTHDENNLYAYFRATGNIGATQDVNDGNGRSGRYYVIVTIDVDDDDDTGYWLHEGGYFPTSDGFDMNMEAEFYDGSLNTVHYLSHDALNGTELNQDFLALTDGNYTPGNLGPYPAGTVTPASGNYDEYTQWVYHDDDTLTLVLDKGPVVSGIASLAISPDGHELEMVAPFKGFLGDILGNPNMALGHTINISFSLEASGELSNAPGTNGMWASDTAAPIIGYYLASAVTVVGDGNSDGKVDGLDYLIWADNYGDNPADIPPGSPENGDYDSNGVVDGLDYLAWAGNFGNGPNDATAVPEPGSFCLAVLAGVGLLMRRRQQA